jgi:hypothetical protein
MHGISEHHSFIIAKIVEQIFITVDKGLLFRRIELARHQLGLAIFHVVALQEIDQGRAGLADAVRGRGHFARTTRLPELPDVPTGCELTSDPRALALIAFAETPFLMALPLVTTPDIPADRLRSLQTAFMAMTQRQRLRRGDRQDGAGVEPDPRRRRCGRGSSVMGDMPKDVIAQFNEIVAPK